MSALVVVMAMMVPTPAIEAPDQCPPVCEKRVRVRQKRNRWQREWAKTPSGVRSHLRAIANCESHDNHRAISAGGTYRGLLQFSFSTWASVGGRGDPAQASRWEQWARGARLYVTGGPGHWPACSR